MAFTRLIACTFFALLALAGSGCIDSESVDPLEPNLRLAGENRKELEKVLDHYAKDADSLKLQAAKFLILNMDAQFSLQDDRMQRMVQYLGQTQGMNDAQANHFVDSVQTTQAINKSGHGPAICDLEIITAEFLINNIDSAFIAWENAPWYDDIDFATFCNYILPYKTANAPIQPWRSAYQEALRPLLSEVRQPERAMNVVDTLLSNTRPMFRYVGKLNVKPDFGASDMLDVKAGKCGQWAYTTNLILRAFAIPSTVIYPPQWANHSAAHVWNGILDSTGHILPYAIEYKVPYVFNPMNWPLKTAKLYMLPYEKCPSSFAMQPLVTRSGDIPKYLTNPCMVDVTSQFVPVSDVPVTVQYPHEGNENYMFLCVFSRGDYNAIDWSRVEDGKAVFKNIGRDVLYLPAFYDQRKYFAAADPVIVSYDSVVSSVVLDTSAWQTLRVYRKYALKGSMSVYTGPFNGMKIQTAHNHEFSKPVDRYVVSRAPGPVITDHVRQRDRARWEEYIDSVEFHPPVVTRYIRFLAAPAQKCIVGEIECYDAKNQMLTGIAYGSKDGAANVQDGIYGEAFDDPDTLGWVALDFEKEVRISKIRYMPAHDSNSVQVGDRYELWYWNREWISLGQQVAEHKYLDFRAPSNALFWLHNLDRGIEERVFTIDSTKTQIWW